MSSEILLFFTSTATSAVSATLGMAGGLILLSVLTMLVGTRDAIPLHGFAQFCSNGGRLFYLWRHIEWKIAARFSLLVIPGGFLGIKTANVLNVNGVQLIVAVVILWFIHGPRLKAVRTPKPNFFIWLGFISSFAGMIAGATGPMIIPFFMNLGLEKKKLIGTKAFCQSLIHFIKIPAFVFFGNFNFAANSRLLALFAVSSFLGAWIGTKIIDRMSVNLYEKIIKWTVTLMALRMVSQAGWALLHH
ncbi:MAG: sulfite exporter TauE/SafE family protein [Bdellovibrionota bacterium]